MKKLSSKKCAYCSISFQGYTAQKYCNDHRNKICRICKKIKEEKNWTWRSLCNKCESLRTLDYYKRKYKENPNFNKELYANKREQKLKNRKKYVANNPEKIKEYYQKNKEKYKLQARTRFANEINREKSRKATRKWIEKDKNHSNMVRNKNNKDFRKRNPHIVAWRNSIYRVLRYLSKKKTSSTFELLGYTSIELKKHIESLFTEGMSWDNYGTWHIDHIKPLIYFSKDTPPSVVNALSNLRPLWKKENLTRLKRPI